MLRRNFLRVAGAASGALATGSALAELNCSPFYPPGVQQCTAGIPSHIASLSAFQQNNTQWCWAACISMVFSYYGHPVSQARIVLETWGEILNMPGQPWDILANLNRPWVDDLGQAFSVYGDSLSANHVTAAQDLAANRPLIIGTMGHAMLLTAVTYMRNGWGQGYIIDARVRDPWEKTGLHSLSPAQWGNANFLVRINVV